jgi:HemY protein
MPVSPVSGRLDAFQWKVPLAEIGDRREAIDASETANDKLPVIVTPQPPAEPAPSVPAEKAPRRAAPKVEHQPEPVIPLIHVPDDPGPDAPSDLEPVPEPSEGAGVRTYK